MVRKLVLLEVLMSKFESSEKVKKIDKDEAVNKKMGNLLLDNCCVCCGKYVTEGSMVCPECMEKYDIPDG